MFMHAHSCPPLHMTVLPFDTTRHTPLRLHATHAMPLPPLCPGPRPGGPVGAAQGVPARPGADAVARGDDAGGPGGRQSGAGGGSGGGTHTVRGGRVRDGRMVEAGRGEGCAEECHWGGTTSPLVHSQPVHLFCLGKLVHHSRDRSRIKPIHVFHAYPNVGRSCLVGDLGWMGLV